nr:hypothetical protein [Paenibacillus xylanexedens]
MSEDRGVYSKYTIIDNETGEQALGEYFVLNPIKDYAARKALMEYANSTKNQQLAMDISIWVSSLDSK